MEECCFQCSDPGFAASDCCCRISCTGGGGDLHFTDNVILLLMFNLGKLSVEVPVGCDQVFAYALNGSFFEGYPVARDRLPLRLANALGRYTKPPSIFCFFSALGRLHSIKSFFWVMFLASTLLTSPAEAPCSV